MKEALDHLEDAETALMSFITRISDVPDDAPDEDVPHVMPVVVAVLRSVSRAAGLIQRASE